jgi:hypothetical protein
MKVGDKIDIEINSISKSALVVKELTFKEYCASCDNLMLEYDIEDAWTRWENSGPCFEMLHPDGRLVVMWPE